MFRRKNVKEAFTLVELLVVIGIIALLIAILMPALSRARKQALQASCGSNERQTTYGMLAYANDWEEELPTMHNTWALSGTDGVELAQIMRLPIIGFDSATIWDWGTYVDGPWVHLGGWAFMMRDYLKNDFDIYVCPDGYYQKNQMMVRWDGTPGWAGINGVLLQRGPCGYLWLPQRGDTEATGVFCYTSQPAFEYNKPELVVHTASDQPGLLVIADMNYFDGGAFASNTCGVRANHNASAAHIRTQVFPPDIGRREDPMKIPLGLNQARIDARVTWVPFQDWIYFRYNAAALGWGPWDEWHAFGSRNTGF